MQGGNVEVEVITEGIARPSGFHRAAWIHLTDVGTQLLSTSESHCVHHGFVPDLWFVGEEAGIFQQPAPPAKTQHEERPSPP